MSGGGMRHALGGCGSLGTALMRVSARVTRYNLDDAGRYALGGLRAVG